LTEGTQVRTRIPAPRLLCTSPPSTLQFLFEDSLVKGNIWNGSSILDQDVLGDMVKSAKVPGSSGRWMEAPLFKVRVTDRLVPGPFHTFMLCVGGFGAV
jgi:hypothetical protein